MKSDDYQVEANKKLEKATIVIPFLPRSTNLDGDSVAAGHYSSGIHSTTESQLKDEFSVVI